MRRSTIAATFLGILVVLAGAVPAHATITGTLTADNHYALYYGKSNGASLSFVGRNEAGVFGNPGTYNWSLPETWTFDGDDYLYVVAWDDRSVAQMWMGEFTLPDGSMLYSNTTDWEFYVSKNANPGENAVLGQAFHNQVAGDIAVATWAAPAVSAPNGTSPWGFISGFSTGSQAQFLWHDTFGNNSSSDPFYVVFRTKDAVSLASIPEPSSLIVWSLIGLSFVGVGWRRRRKG